jgi:hypothetical protein
MLEDDVVATVSLDSETRVRGVCQLMEGLISDIRAEGNDDPGMRQEFLLSMLGSALKALDYFLTMGYSFISRYRERGIISASEESLYRRAMEEKRDSVMETLKREYEILGLAEVEE